MDKRKQNERKFGHWELLADGRRVYSRSVAGRMGWRAVYIKEVDADETILSFRQEIYNDTGRLVEVHQKYPIDTGHRKAGEPC